jgi:beta-N-acetylhexosaminidase
MTAKRRPAWRGWCGRRASGYLALAILATIATALAACATSSSAPITSLRAALPPTAAAAQSAAGSYALSPSVRRQEQILATVNDDLAHMSLDEKLGQMFLIETVWKSYNGDTDAMVRQMHAGAMIVYGQNMGSPDQLRGYLADIQAHAALPMIISMDEEGGGVDRLGTSNFAPPIPAAQDIATDPTSTIRSIGAREAAQMLSFGINTDLAPVADVQGAPDAIEWNRLFSDNPATVERDAGAFLDGLQQNGVIGTLKHWPGIGSITADPHLTLPTVYRTTAQLASTDFATFKALVADAPGMIMVTHVMVPVYDKKYPATLSPTLVDGVLRGQLGYNGVVLTDSLYMKAIADMYTLPEAAVLSVIAGDDLLEGAYDSSSMAAMIAALKGAIASGRITRARIDQSVRRLLTLKARFGLLPLLAPTRGPLEDYGAPIGAAGSADVSRAAIRPAD